MWKVPNNERGVASLVAILILLMLAYLIRGTSFTAGTYVDMIRNFKVENELQLAAESTLAEQIDYYTSESRTFSDKDIENANGTNEVQLRVFNGKIYDASKHILIILAVAKKNNHFGNNISAYRSACAYLIGTETETGVYKYEFGGFLSRST